MSKIREIRERLGLSQEELAKKAKVDRSNLSDYETGKGNPTTKTLAKLAKALSCDIKDLID